MSKLKIAEKGLIPVYEGSEGERVVSARELYDFLEVETRFNDWINRRILEYDFKESQDFYSFLSKTKGRPSTEYHFKIDAAKELAMVENNERGKQIRRYFIEVEKRYHEIKNWQVQRQILKAGRRELTDSIRDYIPESPNKKWKYKSYTDLAYKVVFGKNAKQLKESMGLNLNQNIRDNITASDMRRLEKVENDIAVLIEYKFPYDKICNMVIDKYIRREITGA